MLNKALSNVSEHKCRVYRIGHTEQKCVYIKMQISKRFRCIFSNEHQITFLNDIM